MKGEKLHYFSGPDDIPRMSQYECLLSLPEFAEYAAGVDIGDIPETKKICIFGIGESSIAGDIISAYADNNSNVPVPSICTKVIPRWLDSDTSAVLISHSGRNMVINTIYEKVKEYGCRIYCIASEGSLKERCLKDGNTLLQIPDGLTSRTSLGYELGLLSSLVEKMGICDAKTRLMKTIPLIKEYRDSLFTDKRIYDLKFKLHNNVIAVYGSPDFRASFKRWKMSLNEDMGMPAFCGELPEFNHNEIVGWANHFQNDGDLKIVMLRGKYKNDVLTKIIDRTMEVLEEDGRHVIDIRIPGEDPVEKNMRAIILADYISQLINHEERNPMSWRESL